MSSREPVATSQRNRLHEGGRIEQDPSNASWQREVAVAHSRIGGVLQKQGNLHEAQAAFQEDLCPSG